ncbi:MAG: exodeoxyribonuclease VII large subunit [Crocinitomicaceae bacterium]|nr:exodeoxyribonuclease VII large subunit [Crocinitomicaceae bacterium]
MATSLENFILKNFGSTSYWVTAEIAKTNEKNGHYYLELADSENDKTTALFPATLWSTGFKKIEQNIGKDIYNILKIGNKALFLMRIEYHRLYGLKLNVLDIDPTYTYGEIEKKKQETIALLKKEGLFDLQRQLYLPVIAKRIALVGSPKTAGHRDFLNKLETNEVYRNFIVKQFPASVQGDRAATEIIAALKEADNYNVDAIVLLRGGGSKMDLNVFNDYELCKTICELRLPVITGIGHEYDEVVADLVCRKMCITPTAAAEFLYVQIGSFAASLRNGYDAVINHSRSMVGGLKDEFNHLHKYLMHNSRQFLLEYQWQLNEDGHKLQKGFLRLLNTEHNLLDIRLDKVHSQGLNNIHLALQADLPGKLDRLRLAGNNYMHYRNTELKGLADLLHMLDPQRLLERGYTLSTVEGKDANHLDDAAIGKIMKTLTSKAIISSEIKEIKDK